MRISFSRQGAAPLVIAGALEAEIATLSDPATGWNSAGCRLTEPGVNKLVELPTACLAS